MRHGRGCKPRPAENPSGRRQIRKQNVMDGVANPVRQEPRPAGTGRKSQNYLSVTEIKHLNYFLQNHF
ncbi:MAG: hypothetical protein DRI57_21885 [Deltaproteobacteria bacterium]|nr:MAG: hypothetical protein DRI57_21885 [Deltaproteobacteria bacterium]